MFLLVSVLLTSMVLVIHPVQSWFEPSTTKATVESVQSTAQVRGRPSQRTIAVFKGSGGLPANSPSSNSFRSQSGRDWNVYVASEQNKRIGTFCQPGTPWVSYVDVLVQDGPATLPKIFTPKQTFKDRYPMGTLSDAEPIREYCLQAATGSPLPTIRSTCNASSDGSNINGNNDNLLEQGVVKDSAVHSSDIGSGISPDAGIPVKGQTPYTDVRSFNVRAVSQNMAPAQPGITATTNGGSASVTISSPSIFRNGDGVVIYGAGVPHSMTKPMSPTVTPSVAAAPTGTRLVVNAPAGGKTTYDYVVVARNVGQGLTAGSAVGATTSGSFSLGEQSAGIIAHVRLGNSVTVTTSPHTIPLGAMVYISGTSNAAYWSGWFKVATVPDNTHFTYVGNLDTRNGAPSSGTSGKVIWWNCNHITMRSAEAGVWEYYVYGRHGGTLTPLGVMQPVNANLAGDASYLAWDDFGSPMMNNFTPPAFLPSSPPTTPISDSLVTTIVSGAGTTTLLLAKAATTSVFGATIRFDNAPNIVAAAKYVRIHGGSLYFPAIPSTCNQCNYITNSFLTMPNPMAVVITGSLGLEDTMDTAGNAYYGNVISPQTGSSPQFGWGGWPGFEVGTAYPGIVGGGSFNGLTFNSNVINCALLMVLDFAQFPQFDHVNFVTGATENDYMGIALEIRAIRDDASFPITFRNVLFSGGPTQTYGLTSTPLFYCNNCGGTHMENMSFARRTIFYRPASPGLDFKLDWGYDQGAITPMFMTYQDSCCIGGTAEINHFIIDTSAMPMYVNLGNIVANITVNTTNGPSAEGPGGFVPLISGAPSGDGIVRVVNGPASGVNIGRQWMGAGLAIDGFLASGAAPTTIGISGFDTAVAVGTPYSLFTQDIVQTAPTCSVGTVGPPYSAAGTWRFQYGLVYPNGGVGNLSPASNSCTSNGTSQQIIVRMPSNPPTGSKGFAIYANGAFIGTTLPNTTTNTFKFQFVGGNGSAQVPASGPAGMQNGSVWGATIIGSLYQTLGNCNANSASPAACGSAAAGVVVVPTVTTSYTVNTTAVTANSRIIVQPVTDNSGVSGSPTCNVPSTPYIAYQSTRVPGKSFTFTPPSTAGTTCWVYWILN